MKKAISTLALILAASAFTVIAQDAPPPQAATPAKAKHHKKAGHDLLLNALDANGDGTIDATEIANSPAALKTLDKSGIGQITRDELRPPRPEGAEKPEKGAKVGKAGGGKHEPSPLFAALDANKDGVIDAAEIANAPAALKTLDKNGDGQLTSDEYSRPRPGSADPAGTKNSEKKHKKHGADEAPAATPAPTPAAQ